MNILYSFKYDKKIKNGKDIKVETINLLLKRPDRQLLEEGELFYSVKYSEGIRSGLFTKAMLLKRFKNDGGILSDVEKKEYVSLYDQLFKKQQELSKVLLTDDKNDKEKDDKTDLLYEDITNLKKDIQRFEIDQSSIFDHTADSRASAKTLIWWLVHLAYEQKEDKTVPFFGDGDYDKKLDKYFNIVEKNDQDDYQIINKFIWYVSLWYSGGANSEADFVKLEKDFLDGEQ